MNKELADLLFPNLVKFRKDFEAMYPKRDLPAGAEVLRVAPSPTGNLHTGGLYVGLVNKCIRDKTKGILICRIEDTDKVREVPGARDNILKYFNYYDMTADEGPQIDGSVKGAYGPYVQSERRDIYQAFAYDFVLSGYAYPDFRTEDELMIMRERQTENKVRPGVYNEYASHVEMSLDEIRNKLSKGEQWVLRLKSDGDFGKKIVFVDEMMGELSLSENDEHFVILKSDGIPTYHFANVVDDYTMGVTYVVRANEWVASITKHLELWNKIGRVPPKYAHLMPINKQDGVGVRKLSKRKDSEASVEYYDNNGYPKEALLAYLYRLANPAFDDWWQIGNRDLNKYELDLNAMKRNSRGPLLDFKKLDDISSDVIASKSASVVADELLSWSLKYDTEFYNVISKDRKYLEQVLNIERQTENPRKDIVRYGVAREQIGYFFDDLYVPASIDSDLKSKMCAALQDDALYNNSLNLDDWILRIKDIAANVAPDIKFGAFMMELRKGITGKERTPNMYYLFEVLGRGRIIKRLA